MKKVLTAVIIIAIITLISVSCGATKTCPAYSSVDVEQIDCENV